MKLDRPQLRKAIRQLYKEEHEALGDKGTLDLLEQARQWDLSGTLSAGGVVVFPHAGVADCGHQIATAVHACLDSGADTVLVISVLHAFNDDMQQARVRVAEGADATQEKYWGIQGDNTNNPHTEYQTDHALYSFRHFWQAETKRRGIKGPRVIERYPYLAGGKPEALPGIDELVDLAKNAVIVSTADPFHHGIGYGDLPEKSYPPNGFGLTLAYNTIQEGIHILGAGDYWGYNQHCVRAKSDARDAGQVFRYLRGKMQGKILDLAVSTANDLYKTPSPTWVAGALIEWRKM